MHIIINYTLKILNHNLYSNYLVRIQIPLNYSIIFLTFLNIGKKGKMEKLNFIKELEEYKYIYTSSDVYNNTLSYLTQNEKLEYIEHNNKISFEKLLQKSALESLKSRIKNKFNTYWDKMLDEIKDQHPIFNSIEEIEEKTEWLFITINPRPDVEFNTFKQIITKISQKKWMQLYYYVYEQRGINESELGKGFHSHILINRCGKKHSQIRSEIANTIKHICDTSNPHCYNIQYCKNTDLEKRKNYILGTKAPEDKQIKQTMDIIWREHLGLENYYKKGT